jgi:hypothetical protein
MQTKMGQELASQGQCIEVSRRSQGSSDPKPDTCCASSDLNVNQEKGCSNKLP